MADAPLSADDSDAPVLAEAAAPSVTTDSGNNIRGANNVDIRHGGAHDIDAVSVSITQGGARDIDATTVNIRQGGARTIRADDLNVNQGGVVVARADRLTLEEGGSALVVTTDSATIERGSSVFLLVAGSTEGDVRPVLDWRAAAAFGAAFALVLGLARRVRR